MITSLVVNAINYNKNKTLSAKRVSNGVIEVSFRLSIPGWVNDKELIKEDCHSILYAKSKTGHRYLVNLANIDKGYPSVSNNKYFLITKKYDITTWLKEGTNYRYLLTEERERIFRETRSNIILQQIGQLTNKWQTVSDGKFYLEQPSSLNYGQLKFSKEVNNEFYKCKRVGDDSDYLPF